MDGQSYGYIRVSSRDQREDRQLIAMREAGVPDKNIYMDKQSGKDFERKGYQRMLKKLKPEDAFLSKVSTGLGATMRKSWSSGGSSQKRNGSRLSCWICRFSIRGRDTI